MFKYLALAVTLAVAPITSLATQFVEGTHYTQISNNMVPTEPKVTEFF